MASTTKPFREGPMTPRRAMLAEALTAALPAAAAGQTAAPVPVLPTVEWIGTSPVLGSGIDRDKVPGNVQSLPGRALDQSAAPHLSETLDQRVSSINLNSQQGTPFQTDVQYRGFDASAIFGTPQGLAVHQNGVRINEAFGDTVNW